MRKMSNILSKPHKVTQAPGNRLPAPIRSGQQEKWKGLDQLTWGHMSPGQVKVFLTAVEAAVRWQGLFKGGRHPFFLLTGPIGTGKTTIARNLMAAARVVTWAYDQVYQPEMGEFVDVEVPGTRREVSTGRFWSATLAMLNLDPGKRIVNGEEVGRGRLGQILDGCDLLVVDDIGTEELAYVSAADKTTVRQNRYRELVDWCMPESQNIALVMTSMVPMLTQAGQVNRDFVDIIGPAAFSRLYDQGKGYMFDFTGLPDFRTLDIQKAV